MTHASHGTAFDDMVEHGRLCQGEVVVSEFGSIVERLEIHLDGDMAGLYSQTGRPTVVPRCQTGSNVASSASGQVQGNPCREKHMIIPWWSFLHVEQPQESQTGVKG